MVYNAGNLFTFGGSYLMKIGFNSVNIININEKCPNDCNSNGICDKSFGCKCKDGFFSKDCY